jgi:26S proteasome regulatory subunit N3
MDTETGGLPFRPRSAKAASIPLLPEIETYFHLLIVIHLIDTKCYKKVH